MEIKSRTQLVELMKHLKLPLRAVEVGCAEGILSTEFLQMGIEKLFLVDIWETVPFIDGCASFEPEWHNKNYEGVKEKFKDNKNVTILKGFSYKMADFIQDGSLGLVYIDGDHSYMGVKSDIQSYWPKLVEGGIMAFHDYENYSYGVNRAVQEFAKGEGIIRLEEDGKPENVGAYIIKKTK
jgi:hypothetical protein